MSTQDQDEAIRRQALHSIKQRAVETLVDGIARALDVCAACCLDDSEDRNRVLTTLSTHAPRIQTGVTRATVEALASAAGVSTADVIVEFGLTEFGETSWTIKISLAGLKTSVGQRKPRTELATGCNLSLEEAAREALDDVAAWRKFDALIREREAKRKRKPK